MEIRPILSALMRNKTGPLLVAIQVALSMAILANALHVVNLRQQVAARPSGLADESAVFHMRVRTLADASFEDVVATRERQLAVLRGVPGVVAAAEVNQTPLSRSGNNNSIYTDVSQVEPVANAATYDSPQGLVKAWGLKLVAGRDFTPAELSNADPKADNNNLSGVVIVTKALADKVFAGQPALGKTIYNGSGAGAHALRIVGVVERLQTPFVPVNERAEFSIIRPYRFAGANRTGYTVRVEPGQLDRAMRDAEQALRQSSADPKIIDSISMEKQRQNCYRGDAALSAMLIIVSCLLLLVTSSGIVGMASLWVTQRRKQIGVRRALGARKVDILRYFITENLMITSGGIIGGVLLALTLNHLMVTKLEMVRLPLGYLLAGAGVFWALGIGAAYGPAWRAASIPPATATRTA
jgi:putative ABC transport system permease protein